MADRYEINGRAFKNYFSTPLALVDSGAAVKPEDIEKLYAMNGSKRQTSPTRIKSK